MRLSTDMPLLHMIKFSSLFIRNHECQFGYRLAPSEAARTLVAKSWLMMAEDLV